MVEKKAKTFGQGPPTFFSGNARKKRFFLCEVFPNLNSCPPSLYFSNGRDRHQVADSPVAFDSDYMVRFTTN